LEEAVEEGRLRQDLYYRLNVLSFHLPPLRERPQDVEPLARAFAGHFGARFNKPFTDISPEALAVLESHSWPGNIRQLENGIQHAILHGAGPELRAHDLPESIRNGRPRVAVPVLMNRRAGDRNRRAGDRVAAGGEVNGWTDANGRKPLLQSRADYERRLVCKALEDSHFNRSLAAKALGVSRVTLHKKIKLYGLADLTRRGPAPQPPNGSRPAHGPGDDGNAAAFAADRRES
jgi:DNA-binding NtrC family response regulator